MHITELGNFCAVLNITYVHTIKLSSTPLTENVDRIF